MLEFFLSLAIGGTPMRRIYETERLILKVLDETYAEQVLDYFLRNREFLEEWEFKHPDDFYTIESRRQQLGRDYKDFEENRALRLWIFKKEDNVQNRIIGTIAFNSMVWGAFLSCFMGYKLDKDELNNGYITEALREGIDIIFNEYGLHRIEANIMPKNARSLRVAEKLGFYNEGLALKYLKINGLWEDHIHMVLRNEAIE